MTDSTPVPNRPDPAEAAMKKNREGNGGNRVIKDHIALKNQSSVDAKDYPAKDRDAQSLVDAKKN